MTVQTLREWQRKGYLRLPDTGGWQRYRFDDIFLVGAFKAILAAGVGHEVAVEIAAFSLPILSHGLSDKSGDPSMPYLIVSMGSDGTPNFSLAKHLEDLPNALIETFGDTTASGCRANYVVRFVIDFKGIYEVLFQQLNKHALDVDGKLFWKTDSGLGV
ncbi:hypothetical protein I5535_08600 [Rhodobacteraceae bacterium F11138]|nr:hypothetical protein [Rhodobacteraceae bacterium F11138]